MSTAEIHLEQLLEPFAGCFSTEVAAKIADLQADEAMQARIDYLADQANESLLTAQEQDEYTGYLRAIDIIAVLQAKARAQIHRDS